MDNESFPLLLTDLTGQEPPFPDRMELVASRATELLKGGGIGYSQFNEMLLFLGYDRISLSYFDFLLGEPIHESEVRAFKSLVSLREAVDQARILAIIEHGNVKYGFKNYSNPATDAIHEHMHEEHFAEEHYTGRHEALIPIENIPANETYYLGYVIGKQIEDSLKENPEDKQAQAEGVKRRQIVDKGRRNQDAYLTSDHMDVYVATSMRARHEYHAVAQLIKDVFALPSLKRLKVRYFDPTQAYCEDRIDKGLAEALMLKRATCTLYLAQESDTLGKDSELACTLAQGKPVIAYVPKIENGKEVEWARTQLALVMASSSDGSLAGLALKQLRALSPTAAWDDDRVRRWLDSAPDSLDEDEVLQYFGTVIRDHYEKRAQLLKEVHPLGIQVNLEKGVANGVLVARSAEECAEVIARILLGSLEFELDHKEVGGQRYLLLRESVTRSIFRVVSGDSFLTNAFWNFYLAK